MVNTFKKIFRHVSDLAHRLGGTSLRVRVLLLVLVATVPLVGERIYGLAVGRADLVHMAESQMLQMARQGALSQQALVSSARSAMETIALTPYITDPSAPGCNKFLTTLEAKVDSVNALSILSPDGRVLCSSNSKARDLDLSARRQIRAAIANKGFSVGDIVTGHVRRRPTLGLALAKAANDGRITGIVAATLDLKYLGKLVAELAKDPSIEAFAIDGKDTVVVHYPDPDVWVGRKAGVSAIAKAIRGSDSGAVSLTDASRTPRIYGYYRLPDTRSYFVVGLSAKLLFANVDREFKSASLTMAAMLLIILCGVWFGGERLIVRPIERLVRRAVRLGHGDYSKTDAMQDMAAEFRPLGRALAEIQQQLANRELRLREENSELDTLAQSDPMTGLANRRRLDSRLSSFVEQCAAAKTALAVFMIDVDHFKSYNDHYGHLAGDQCLKAIASTIRSWFRENDLVARYGGEEFMVVVPGLSPTAMRVLAGKICEAVRALQIPHCGSPFGAVTVSIGVVNAVPEIGKEVIDLLQKADAALYRAKDRGRNTVAIFDDAKDLAIAS